MKFKSVKTESQQESGFESGSITEDETIEKVGGAANLSNEEMIVYLLQLQDNMVIRNRTWKAVIYENCFTGQDLFKYSQRAFELSNDEIIRLGKIWMDHGLIKYVKRNDDAYHIYEIKNGPFFYQFVTQRVDPQDDDSKDKDSSDDEDDDLVSMWFKAQNELSNGKQPQICQKNSIKLKNILLKVDFGSAAGNLKPVTMNQVDKANAYLDSSAIHHIMQRRQFINQDDSASDGDYSDDSAGFY